MLRLLHLSEPRSARTDVSRRGVESIACREQPSSLVRGVLLERHHPSRQRAHKAQGENVKENKNRKRKTGERKQNIRWKGETTRRMFATYLQ